MWIFKTWKNLTLSIAIMLGITGLGIFMTPMVLATTTEAFSQELEKPIEAKTITPTPNPDRLWVMDGKYLVRACPDGGPPMIYYWDPDSDGRGHDENSFRHLCKPDKRGHHTALTVGDKKPYVHGY